MLNPYHNAIRQYCELQARRGSNMTLELTAGQLGQGYYYDDFGNDYAGSNGFGGLVVVYA